MVLRKKLPNARIAVDKWHLVALANQMVTEVRQRVTRERLRRRGTTAEKTWTHRQLVPTGYEHPWAKQVARLRAALAAEDLTNEIGAAHAVKERLRLLLNASDAAVIRSRPFDFYNAAADSHMAQTTRLARTIETWTPAILTALIQDVTNARTEGFNRIIKDTKRVGCGYRNMNNYRRRILAHIALTRGDKAAA